MTQPAITKLEQLTSKKVGVLTDTYSGQTGVIARLAVERAGAAATYVGLGTYRNIFAALAAEDIDAGALPIDFQFLEQSQHRWNCFEAHSLHVSTILATTRRTIWHGSLVRWSSDDRAACRDARLPRVRRNRHAQGI